MNVSNMRKFDWEMGGPGHSSVLCPDFDSSIYFFVVEKFCLFPIEKNM